MTLFIWKKNGKNSEKMVELNKFQSLDVLNCISKEKQNENSHDLKRGCSEKLIFLFQVCVWDVAKNYIEKECEEWNLWKNIRDNREMQICSIKFGICVKNLCDLSFEALNQIQIS